MPYVCFACNDPDNGHATDRVRAIDVADLLSLEGDELEFREDDAGRLVYLAGRWFAVNSRFTPWVGNWCWDGAEMDARTLAALLNHLRRQHWTLDEAESTLYEAYDRGEEITEAMIMAAIGEAA